MDNQETFVDIQGFEGLYQISNLGRVKSLRTRFKGHTNPCNMILVPNIQRSGYIDICLTNKDGKLKRLKIHRLIAIAFIPNINNKPQINHINGIKTDNNINNLEWCTRNENIQHAWRMGLYKKKTGSNHAQSKKVSQYDLKGNFIKIFNSMGEAHRETGVSQGSICLNCLDKIKHAKKFIWRYATT